MSFQSDMRPGMNTVEVWGDDVTFNVVPIRTGFWRTYIYGMVNHPNYIEWDKVDDDGKPLPGARGKHTKQVNIAVGFVEHGANDYDYMDVLRLFRDEEQGEDEGYYTEYQATVESTWKGVFPCPEEFTVCPGGEMRQTLLIYRSGYQS